MASWANRSSSRAKYERRIEHSLCRILGELRRERLYQNLEARTQDDGNRQVLLERLMRKIGPPSPTAVLRMEPGIARWEEPEEVSRLKGQVASDGADNAEEMWEKVARGECQASVGCVPRTGSSGAKTEMGCTAHPTTSNSAADRSCETKPILTTHEAVSGHRYTLTGIPGIISGYESSPEV
jgi:hypothetical protein